MQNIHSNLVSASNALLEAQSKSILLIEDTAAHALLIQRAFGKTEWSIEHVTRGSAALDSLRSNPNRLILLDLTLPDIDGIELTTELHEINPYAPIIVVTSTDDVKKSVAAMQNGAWDYVIKSEPDVFNSTILQSVNHSWKKRLFKAEHRLASECRVAELIKSEKVEAVEQAIQLICSEVNNSLSGLLMYSDLLGRDCLSDPQREILQQLTDSAQKVASAVQKVKSLTKSPNNL